MAAGGVHSDAQGVPGGDNGGKVYSGILCVSILKKIIMTHSHYLPGQPKIWKYLEDFHRYVRVLQYIWRLARIKL